MNFPLHLSCLGSTQINTMLSNTQIFIEYFMRKVIIRITAHYSKHRKTSDFYCISTKYLVKNKDQWQAM